MFGIIVGHSGNSYNKDDIFLCQLHLSGKYRCYVFNERGITFLYSRFFRVTSLLCFTPLPLTKSREKRERSPRDVIIFQQFYSILQKFGCLKILLTLEAQKLKV